MNAATQPFRSAVRAVGSIGSSVKGLKLSGRRLPDTSWTTNEEDYGTPLDPVSNAHAEAYEGSFFAAALVATHTFVSRNYGSIMLVVILCVAASLLCAGLHMYYKRTRQIQRDVQEHEWGVCRTVDEVLRHQKQAIAKTTRLSTKYHPVISHDLKHVEIYN